MGHFPVLLVTVTRFWPARPAPLPRCPISKPERGKSVSFQLSFRTGSPRASSVSFHNSRLSLPRCLRCSRPLLRLLHDFGPPMAYFQAHALGKCVFRPSFQIGSPRACSLSLHGSNRSLLRCSGSSPGLLVIVTRFRGARRPVFKLQRGKSTFSDLVFKPEVPR